MCEDKYHHMKTIELDDFTWCSANSYVLVNFALNCEILANFFN